MQKMISRPRYRTHLVDYRFNVVRDSNTIKIISSEIRRRDAGKLSLLCFKRSTVYGNYHVTTRCERLHVGSELWYERLFLVCSSSCSIARALRILILTISISPFPSPLYPVHTNTVFKLRVRLAGRPRMVCTFASNFRLFSGDPALSGSLTLRFA